MSVIARVFKWLGPIAIPFDAYEAFEDEPLTTAGMMHGSADFLSMQVGGVVVGAVGFLATGGHPVAAMLGGGISAERSGRTTSRMLPSAPGIVSSICSAEPLSPTEPMSRGSLTSPSTCPTSLKSG